MYNKVKEIFAEKNWHRLFELGLIIKGVNGVIETLSGFFVIFASKATINTLFFNLTRGELLEDPHDRLINFIMHSLGQLSTSTKLFAAIYILTHGLLNIFLAIQLYREKLWAYLVTINLMILFIIYQIYRISYNHSLILTLITIWDIIFVIVLWHEYKYHKKQKLLA
ncbi:MAG: DUF2127 domain-containing protein [Candidatus Doudnabacteria bacterium]